MSDGGRGDRPPIGPELERLLRDAVARDLAARPEPAAERDDVPPETLDAALAGRLPEGERVRALDRATRTGRGLRELALLHTARAAAAEAWPETRSASRGRGAWWLRPGVAAAAAVVLAAGLGGGAWWRMMHSSPNAPAGADPVRTAGAGTPAIVLRTPDVEARPGEPAVLAWGPAPGVARYEVEVLRPDGTVVWSAATGDTTVRLPATALPPAGTAYDWWVRARTPGGESRRSPTGRVRVR